MSLWTVQCSFVSYDANTVVVEAGTLDEALEKAIKTANESDGWSSLDISGNTFVDAVAEGDDADPWRDFAAALPVPERFSERGELPCVTVTVSGGVVQDVAIDGGKVRVFVRDYDMGDDTDPEILTDAEGDGYALADWSNRLPPQGAADQLRTDECA